MVAKKGSPRGATVSSALKATQSTQSKAAARKPSASGKAPAAPRGATSKLDEKAQPTPATAKRQSPTTAKAAPKPRATPQSSSEQPGSEAARLELGKKAPAFKLMDQQGQLVSSSELAGQPYVLYFYPRDDTPGCTTEACGFRDHQPDFSGLKVRVLGVSPDGVGSHRKFTDKFGLNFTLLADPDKVLCRAYGAWAKKKNYGKEYMGVVRSTFLVDKLGVLRKAWHGVKVAGHAEAVLQAAREFAA